MSVRETMLRDAIEKAESPTLEAVAALLPADFDLDQAELDAASKSLKNFEPPRANGDGQSHIDPADTTPQPDRDVEAEIVECDNELIELQQKARVARNDLAAARGKLDDAKRAVNANGRTPESVTREYIASSQAERAKVAAGLTQAPAVAVGDSHYDRMRAGSRGHSIDQGYKRRAGTFPASAQNAPAKLQGER